MKGRAVRLKCKAVKGNLYKKQTEIQAMWRPTNFKCIILVLTWHTAVQQHSLIHWMSIFQLCHYTWPTTGWAKGNNGKCSMCNSYPVSNVAAAVGHRRTAVTAAAAAILPAPRAWATAPGTWARARPAVIPAGAPVRARSTDRTEGQTSFENN